MVLNILDWQNNNKTGLGLAEMSWQMLLFFLTPFYVYVCHNIIIDAGCMVDCIYRIYLVRGCNERKCV